MKKEETKCSCGEGCKCCGEFVFKKSHNHHSGCSKSDALYGLGVIGSLFYFLNGAVGLGPVIVGIAKAFFWPAFVVFKILGILSI
jgi:hypothetical protein